MKELWVDKWRPKVIDEYVFTDQTTKEQVEDWIAKKSIPHLLLYGPPGTGKTTLAKVLVNQLEINSFDFLQVNASRDNGVDYLKDRIEGFVSTIPFGHLKIVLLDEADFLSLAAQGILRGLIETYQEHARFIMTCNLAHKIVPPLKSRCFELAINKTNAIEFTSRAATVLVNENVEFDLDTLDTYVKATYPDLRKCLNLLQNNSNTGKLLSPKEADPSTLDWKIGCVELFKEGKIRQARQLMCDQCHTEEAEVIFRWMYDNLSLWSATPEGQDEAILIIRRGLVQHTSCADPEINLSATLCELTQIDK